MAPERQRKAALPVRARAADVPDGGGPRARPSSAPPWQFLVRAVAVITGLTMLLIVDVRGVAFYFAWALIVLALATEALAHVRVLAALARAAAARDFRRASVRTSVRVE